MNSVEEAEMHRRLTLLEPLADEEEEEEEEQSQDDDVKRARSNSEVRVKGRVK